MRFFIAWVVLSMLTRKIEKPKSVRDELGIFALSLLGITFYYYFENTALIYTLSANVSIILSAVSGSFGKRSLLYYLEYVY